MPFSWYTIITMRITCTNDVFRSSDILTTSLSWGNGQFSGTRETKILWPISLKFRKIDFVGETARKFHAKNNLSRLAAWGPTCQIHVNLYALVAFPCDMHCESIGDSVLSYVTRSTVGHSQNSFNNGIRKKIYLMETIMSMTWPYNYNPNVHMLL
jgi:hypothetical protein